MSDVIDGGNFAGPRLKRVALMEALLAGGGEVPDSLSRIVFATWPGLCLEMGLVVTVRFVDKVNWGTLSDAVLSVVICPGSGALLPSCAGQVYSDIGKLMLLDAVSKCV